MAIDTALLALLSKDESKPVWRRVDQGIELPPPRVQE